MASPALRGAAAALAAVAAAGLVHAAVRAWLGRGARISEQHLQRLQGGTEKQAQEEETRNKQELSSEKGTYTGKDTLAVAADGSDPRECAELAKEIPLGGKGASQGPRVLVLYCSQTGTTRALALRAAASLAASLHLPGLEVRPLAPQGRHAGAGHKGAGHLRFPILVPSDFFFSRFSFFPSLHLSLSDVSLS